MRDSIARIEAARRESMARAERVRAERETAARAALLTPIYFDYDDATLSADARRLLDAKFSVLVEYAVQVRISGHADDRGSDEYNLALGQRRAAAVMKYLSDRGIAGARMQTVSYGESRPICTDARDSCWSRNRRAEFEVLEGM